MTFVLFELAPFIALAFVARRLGRWLTLACALAFGGLILETAREVSESSSSTAAIAFVVVPFVLLALLLIVLAVNEGVRLVIRWRRGGASPAWLWRSSCGRAGRPGPSARASPCGGSR